MKKIAYLRVSTAEQRPDRQIDGLKALCEELHIERLSAVSKCRPVYEEVIATLQQGDVFVIWDLDRAYRSAKDALNELDALRDRGIEVHIANLSLDTSTPYGKLLYTVVSGLAEFERNLLSQRTKEGMEAARRRGKQIGRPRKLNASQLNEARRRVGAESETLKAIASSYGIAPWTLSRSLKRTL